MLRTSLKLLAAACTGAAMLAATPASAHTVIMYFNTGGFMTGWVEYANDGHICQKSGTIPGSTPATYQLPGDCT